CSTPSPLTTRASRSASRLSWPTPSSASRRCAGSETSRWSRRSSRSSPTTAPGPSGTVARNSSKTCTLCGEQKPLTDYYKHPNGRLGLQSRCKRCHDKVVREARQRNPEKYKGAQRRRREQNPRVQKAVNTWKRNNRERVNASRRKRRALWEYGLHP